MSLKDRIKLVGIFLFILGADFFTKLYVDQHIPLMESSKMTYPFGGVPVFYHFFGIDFSLNHVTNTGAAWGFFSHYQIPLLIFRCVLIFLLSIYLLRQIKEFKKLLPYVLVLSGAVGNIMDYFYYGHVVDMFHFVFWGYSYPVFNIADASIFIGVASIITASFFAQFKQTKLYNILFSQK